MAKLGGKALTSELRKLASEVHTITDDGTPITKEQALAKMIWDMALGGEQLQRNEEGTLVKTVVKPVAWAQQFLFERIEGRAMPATSENDSSVKASDKVRALARERLNGLAKTAVGVSAAIPAPPSHTKRK